jgi:hypothetical protein
MVVPGVYDKVIRVCRKTKRLKVNIILWGSNRRGRGRGVCLIKAFLQALKVLYKKCSYLVALNTCVPRAQCHQERDPKNGTPFRFAAVAEMRLAAGRRLHLSYAASPRPPGKGERTPRFNVMRGPGKTRASPSRSPDGPVRSSASYQLTTRGAAKAAPIINPQILKGARRQFASAISAPSIHPFQPPRIAVNQTN